jgi:hypothetical protein
MKKHPLFRGEGFHRKDKNLIQQTNNFYNYFEPLEKRAYRTPKNRSSCMKMK